MTAKHGRPSLGFTELIALKVPPTLKAYLDARAADEFCTIAEYLRRLIVADMRTRAEI
jgi:hypothetical protein